MAKIGLNEVSIDNAVVRCLVKVYAVVVSPSRYNVR